MRNLLGYFHYYSLVFKNAFDILKGLGIYEHFVLLSSKAKNINKIFVVNKRHTCNKGVCFADGKN